MRHCVVLENGGTDVAIKVTPRSAHVDASDRGLDFLQAVDLITCICTTDAEILCQVIIKVFILHRSFV